MKQEINNNQGTTRKQYVTPELVEYGTVAKLTQGTGGSGTDTNQVRRQCL